jgi:predicted HAD superfamily Cof-like phosphohydrolase
MINYVGMLQQFHSKYDHKISFTPKIPDIATVVLRRKLVAEEAEEFDHAAATGNLVEVADALADLLYVTFGAALAFGIPIDEIFAEVHRSNMTKSTAKNEFGKTIKGEFFDPPDLKSILEREMKQ